jgi:CHAT domain-containing protein
MIHVATHGILNDVDPMSSHLLLAPSGEGASAEDGRLQARELLSLGLDAELAVLSGCDTAKGRTGRGEGVIGLTWALFIAGVPITVVSQWQVESESTEQLMVGLHRRLAATPAASPAEALRASATAMLASDRYRHPFYWAGFITVGDGFRPLD